MATLCSSTMPSTNWPTELTRLTKKWLPRAFVTCLIICLMTSLNSLRYYSSQITHGTYSKPLLANHHVLNNVASNLLLQNEHIWQGERFIIQRNITADVTTVGRGQNTSQWQDHVITDIPLHGIQQKPTPEILEAIIGRDVLDNTNFRRIPPDMVQLMAPEISKFIGKERLTNYKNPCWARTPLSIFCVPYFFLLGVTKCGTSDIYQKLIKHPQIVHGISKESHWWTQRRLGSQSAVASFEKELKRGVQFLGMPNRIQEKSMKVIGDGSPSTFWDNHNWRRIFPNHPEGPPYVVADLIHAVDPEAKLIVSLRDPVERMYSGYNFFTSQHSPEVFHEKVVERLAIFNKCLSVNSLRACAYQDILTFNPVSRDKPVMQLRMGIYHVFLQDWLEVYPNEQLFVLELTDWQQNCLPLLRQLYHFLELEPLPESQLAQFCQAPMRNKAKHTTKPMLDKTRQLLEEFYKPYNKKLYEILKDKKFNWDYT